MGVLMRTIIAVLSVLVMAQVSYAAHLHPEKEYQAAWCADAKGQTEFRLDDKARVDCLTDQYAVEFDFAEKWGESIGQALYYGLKTGKTPGVVLIMEDEANEGQHYDRLKAVADKYKITVWAITPKSLEGI